MTMPDGRTGRYSLWRACERFGILPPEIRKNFKANSNYNQASLLAYSTIRQAEESGMVTKAVTDVLRLR